MSTKKKLNLEDRQLTFFQNLISSYIYSKNIFVYSTQKSGYQIPQNAKNQPKDGWKMYN